MLLKSQFEHETLQCIMYDLFRCTLVRVGCCKFPSVGWIRTIVTKELKLNDTKALS
mgnify:CR=1 FL=1